jgi:hypothetical protein
MPLIMPSRFCPNLPFLCYIGETNVLRNIRKVENVLIKSGLFNVQGKKKVKELDSETKVLVVDVVEHEVERPKKTEKTLQW